MSGHSTLRICLAAMAPALTEAASERLKLDTSAKRNKLTETIDNSFVARLNALRKHSNIDETFKLSKNSIKLAKTSFSKSENSKKCYDLNSHNKSRLNPNLLSESCKTFFEVSEDFQADFVDHKEFDLKIMNRPDLAEIESSKLIANCKESITTKDTNVQNNQNLSNMVNGSEDSQIKSDESGDASSVSKLRNKVCINTSTNNCSEDISTNTRNMGISSNGQRLTNECFRNGETSKSTTWDNVNSEKLNDEMRRDCTKKQAFLERKVDILLRRMKRIKGKIVETHAKDQLMQFVNFQHHHLMGLAKAIKNEAPVSEALKEHILSKEEVRKMSTTEFIKMINRHNTNRVYNSDGVSRNNISCSLVVDKKVRSESKSVSERIEKRLDLMRSELDSDATASSSGGESADEESSPQLLFEDNKIPFLLKRAEYKWASERSSVVSKWTWLQAQISDLEYRIRQQSQIHRQLKSGKGGVVLGEPPTATDIFRRMQGIPPANPSTIASETNTTKQSIVTDVSPCNISAVMSNVEKHASRLTQSLGNCLSPSSSTLGSPVDSKISSSSPHPNSLTNSPSIIPESRLLENSPLNLDLGIVRHHTNAADNHYSPPDATCQAARCRPLRSYRKRKILRTIGLYKSNSKAAKFSNIRCRCSHPNNPCPMCGGRYNNTMTIDTDNMSFNERVALLDPSFHPVLSFPQDVQLSIHCEGVLKSGLWQNKPPPKRSKQLDGRKKKVLSLVADPLNKDGVIGKQNGRNNHKPVINFTNKIKNKYESKAKQKKKSPENKLKKKNKKKVKKKSKLNRAEAMKCGKEDADLLEDYLLADDDPTVTTDALSSSGSQSNLKDLRADGHGSHRKRKFDNSYDINNIVIPMSMAASVRAEHLQYKEILTPKWREVQDRHGTSASKQLEKSNGISQISMLSKDEEEMEDLSDEKFTTRHTICERKERLRHLSFVQYPPNRRARFRFDAKPGHSIDTCVGEDEEREDYSADSSRPSTPVFNRSYPVFQSSLKSDFEELQAQTNRRRSSSYRRDRSSSCYEELHSSLVEIQVEPWPRRSFPLTEQEYECMVKDAPASCEPVHHTVPRRVADVSGKIYVGYSTENGDDSRPGYGDSRATSPQPSESLSTLSDDPNDPEWGTAGTAFNATNNTDINKKKNRRVEDECHDPEWKGSELAKTPTTKNRR